METLKESEYSNTTGTEEETDLSRAGMFLLAVMALNRRMMWMQRKTAMLS